MAGMWSSVSPEIMALLAKLGSSFGSSGSAPSFSTQAIDSPGGLSSGDLSSGLAASPSLSGISPSQVTGATAPTSSSSSSDGGMMGALPGLSMLGSMGGGGGGSSGGPVAGGLGGAMSGAATGAMLGSVVPGIGTAIGAVVGGLAGGAMGALNSKKGGSGAPPTPSPMSVRPQASAAPMSLPSITGGATSTASPLPTVGSPSVGGLGGAPGASSSSNPSMASLIQALLKMKGGG